jgi:hypothetical protein
VLGEGLGLVLRDLTIDGFPRPDSDEKGSDESTNTISDTDTGASDPSNNQPSYSALAESRVEDFIIESCKYGIERTGCLLRDSQTGLVSGFLLSMEVYGEKEVDND